MAISNIRRLLLAASRHQNIFLLSHMRAYTSLLGHIIGSNPQVCGYYEMHIGYHSWKSLIRQKLIYFEDEAPKPDLTFMFDKVLHNDHDVAVHLLDSPRVKTLFALRHPAQTIPSILNLYSTVDPTHEYNSAAFSTDYYIARLEELERLAGAMQQAFFYFDAEAVKENTENTLAQLSDWLALTAPLQPEYELQKKTSAERAGDASQRLRAGVVDGGTSAAATISVDAQLIARAEPVYRRVRALLLEKSAASSTL